MSADTDRAARMTALREEVRAVIAESGVPRYARCDAWMRGHDPFQKYLADFTARQPGDPRERKEKDS
jgi:hypothetical protein